METRGICLETIVTRGKLSSCDHGFCFDCIHKWSEQTNTCPICKQRFSQLKRIEPEDNAPKEEQSRRGTKRKKEDVDVVDIPYRNQSVDDHFDPNDWWSEDDSGSDDMEFFFMDPAFHLILIINQLSPSLFARHHSSIIDLTQEDEPPENNDDDEAELAPPPPRRARTTSAPRGRHVTSTPTNLLDRPSPSLRESNHLHYTHNNPHRNSLLRQPPQPDRRRRPPTFNNNRSSSTRPQSLPRRSSRNYHRNTSGRRRRSAHNHRPSDSP